MGIKSEFTLESAAEVAIEIYELSGKLVTTLQNESFMAGRQTLQYNVSELHSGVYIYKVLFDKQLSATGKMVVAK